MAENTCARYLPTLGALLLLSWSAGHAAIFLPRLPHAGNASPSPSQVSVRDELEQLQKQNGLTIGIFNYQGLGLNIFQNRKFIFHNYLFEGNAVTGAVSRDGTEIAFSQLLSKPSTVVVMHPDGRGRREYTGISANSLMCWSYDNSKLVLGTAGPKLQLLELKSGSLEELPISNLPARSLSDGQILTSQCWSPDGKQIVYEASDEQVFVYDFDKRVSLKLAAGTDPTWSPDGNWIAYRSGDDYYAIHPFGERQKVLFHKTRAVSGLYWSPDSRFVAYVHQDFFALDTEFYHLMIRRLEDNSEDWVADGENAGAGYNYQWVVNKELLTQPESAPRAVTSPKTIATPPRSNESVREELIRQQTETGLAIAWFDHDGPEIVIFHKRAVLIGKKLVGQRSGVGTISRDGTQIALQLDTPTKYPPSILGIMKADNSDLREFQNVARPAVACWSNDMAQVAVVTANTDGSRGNHKVLDVDSKSVRDIAPHVRITSQCWSPDDKEILFESGGNVIIQGADAAKPRVLAVGAVPTWSPDGNWIAYQDEHTHRYYVIHPSGEGKKELFHSRNGMPGLYWSPDSRMVAYVVEGGGLLFLDAEVYRLRVRRLEDNSDDWVADGVDCCRSIEWMTSKDLLNQIESQPARK